MDMASFKRWCCANIIWPGVALVDYNDTREPPPPTCHLPAYNPPGSRFLDFMEENWVVVFFITLAIVMSVGVVLAIHHMRWRRLLREQLDAGHIDEQQYDRLR
jgi:hypothetical protein